MGKGERTETMKRDEDWVGELVIAKTYPGEVYGKGRIIGYASHPTYTIERPDGTRFSWAAHLCELELVNYDEPAELREIINDKFLAGPDDERIR